MGEIQKLIRIWSTRNLTPYGKVTIIKSLLISKIIHMLLSLPSTTFYALKSSITLFQNVYGVGNLLNGGKRFLRANFIMEDYNFITSLYLIKP